MPYISKLYRMVPAFVLPLLLAACKHGGGGGGY
jgi:hypothetical protein